jgi:hypothetical protein
MDAELGPLDSLARAANAADWLGKTFARGVSPAEVARWLIDNTLQSSRPHVGEAAHELADQIIWSATVVTVNAHAVARALQASADGAAP